MGAKHTPGPWTFLPLSASRIDPPHKQVVAIVKGQGPGHGGLVVAADDIHSAEVAGNAHLIAAAPDLLAAVKRLQIQMFNLALVCEVPERLAKSFNEGQAQASAAIAKAEGRARNDEGGRP